MPDQFRRISVTNPRMIQAAVSDALPPEDKRLANYRGMESRRYQPADFRTFEVDPQSYLTTIAVTHGGSLRVASVADQRGTACAMLAPGPPAYCMCLVQRGSAGLRMAGSRDVLGLDQNTGVIYEGHAGTSFVSSDDNQRLTVWIPFATLHGCLEALVERPVTNSISFAPAIDVTAKAGASLGRLLGHLGAELSRPDSLMSRQVTTNQFEELLCSSIVLGLKHDQSPWVEPPRPAGDLRSVRRAEDYLHAHLEEPIKLRDLARSAGCGVRSLQLAFRRARGVTPMEALRRARLERARRALEHGEPWASVIDIAVQFGFNHPGRFAGLYERTFGQKPSRTLRNVADSSAPASPFAAADRFLTLKSAQTGLFCAQRIARVLGCDELLIARAKPNSHLRHPRIMQRTWRVHTERCRAGGAHGPARVGVYLGWKQSCISFPAWRDCRRRGCRAESRFAR